MSSTHHFSFDLVIIGGRIMTLIMHQRFIGENLHPRDLLLMDILMIPTLGTTGELMIIPINIMNPIKTPESETNLVAPMN